jgi:hypothetical protein
MKTPVKLIITAIFLMVSSGAHAQRKYTSSSGELIFSFANYVVNNNSINTPLRFTAFFHVSKFYHLDVSDAVGFYTGTGVRNVGFTEKQGNTTIKRRNYYVGMPLAIKLGNLDEDKYIYAGVEGEVGLNYKEKRFEGDNKVDVFDEWFSARTPLFMPSVMAGYNTTKGFNLKVRYYLFDFLNPNYVEQGQKIYSNIQSSNIFYIGVSYNVPDKKRFKKKTKSATPISI